MFEQTPSLVYRLAAGCIYLVLIVAALAAASRPVQAATIDFDFMFDVGPTEISGTLFGLTKDSSSPAAAVFLDANPFFPDGVNFADATANSVLFNDFTVDDHQITEVDFFSVNPNGFGLGLGPAGFILEGFVTEGTFRLSDETALVTFTPLKDDAPIDEPVQVPEPSTLFLMMLGIAGLVAIRRRTAI